MCKIWLVTGYLWITNHRWLHLFCSFFGRWVQFLGMLPAHVVDQDAPLGAITGMSCCTLGVHLYNSVGFEQQGLLEMAWMQDSVQG